MNTLNSKRNVSNRFMYQFTEKLTSEVLTKIWL